MNQDKIEEGAKALYYQYCRGRGWTEDKWENEPNEVKEQYLDEACQLFEPKPDERWIQEEIDQAKVRIDVTALRKDVECRQRVDRIFKEIEDSFIWGQVPILDLEKGDVEWTMRCMKDEDWQALKKQEGVE